MNTSSLEIARKDDMGIRVELLVRVNVAERPVLVALAYQIIERARGITVVAGATIARGVQYAYIEPTVVGRRVG
jgi:hypothetical protein